MNIANKPWLLQGVLSRQGSFIVTARGKVEEYCSFDILATGTVSVDYTRDGESYHEEYERTPESPALTIAIEMTGQQFDIKLSGDITSIILNDYCYALAVDGAKSLSSIQNLIPVEEVRLRKCNMLLSIDCSEFSVNAIHVTQNSMLEEMRFVSVEDVNITDCENLKLISFSGPESPCPVINISGKTNIDRIVYAGDNFPQEDAMKNGITALIESSTAETGTVDCTNLSPVAPEEFKTELQALVEGYGWTITF